MERSNIPEEIQQWNARIRQNPELTEGMGHVHLLSVPGRVSGQLRATPVSPIEYAGQRWLFAGFGEADWVKNLRTSRWGILTKRKQLERITVAEVEVEKRAPLLHAFVQHIPAEYFSLSVGPDEPLEAFAAIADRHPVFQILTATSISSFADAIGKQTQ
ncbi:DUF385 domain-containing protein [Ktedonosporobacter rubrisoli]|uniref:DUF385 domain-containing protein n=1 Tax=Ktedonosporobacter rubrisoli TaxID=2509675 RepID=A0A4P6JK11_KTERU|nr:nitroreductase/quinone reductase family protein [Ktedonosporobacter rubrisoli]QBD75469.1 DUF385 domain-containing protein [Ktedonosporobacter rubrisoli]